MDKKISTLQKPREVTKAYSDRYTVVRAAAESRWPAWKVSVYNSSVAVSAHAKKVAQK